MSQASVRKGKVAERQIANILRHEMGILVHRNLDQCKDGGYDLNGLPGMAIEVKRHETTRIPAWWKQTLRQCPEGFVPVLVYRKNHADWKWIVGEDMVKMTTSVFIKYLTQHLKKYELDQFIDTIKLRPLRNTAEHSGVMFCPVCGIRDKDSIAESIPHTHCTLCLGEFKNTL